MPDNCNGSPYGFNCQGLRGAPKKWPKFWTPARTKFMAFGQAVPNLFAILAFVLQSPGPPIQSPGTPNPQKCILMSEKCHFGPPEKMAPKSQLRCPKSRFLDVKMSPPPPKKAVFLVIFIDFWGLFLWVGPIMAFFGL